jgi:hypothetical protein
MKQAANFQFSIFNFQFSIFIFHFSFCIVLAAPAYATPLAVPVEGPPFRAELSAADAQWQLTFIADHTRRIMPAADLVYWGQCAELSRAGAVVLADGGLLSATVLAADKERLTIDSDSFGTVKLPLESLAGVVFHLPPARQDRDKLLDRIARAAGDGDRLLLDNGDELAGLIEGIAAGAVKLKADVGPVEVKTDRVTAIIFDPALKRKPPAADGRLQAWIGLGDGSRLLATQLSLQGDSLKITTAGQPLSALPSSLVFLQPLGGRAIYLSDLKPAEYRQTPYLDLKWPYQTDRNVTDGLLRCGGRLFLKGIGVHSAARLVYSLSPLPLGEGPGVTAASQPTSPRPLAGEGPGVRARRFEAEVGIDDSTAGGGSVVFHVLVDGQDRFTSKIIRGGDAPRPISVDVTGATKLELLVDYADRADVLDHADWLNARLVQ